MGKVHVLDNELDNLAEALELAQDARTVKQAMQNFAIATGFKRFAFLNVRASEAYAISTYAAEWQKIYHEKHYVRIDPVVTSAKRSAEIFTWSQEDAPASKPEVVRFFAEADDFGIRSGLSIPIRAPFGRTAILTLASEERRVEFSEVRDRMKAVTAVAFTHVHLNRLMTRPCHAAKFDLTPRQSTCLAWASLGRTMSETAALLHISERSVRFHLEAARDKLCAKNIAHAIRLAVELKLL